MADDRRHNTDGRIARGERTREAIIDAHSALLLEGVLKPTGKLLAERAGISLRTLWSNYNDLEAVMRASVAHWLECDAALQVSIAADDPLDRRVDAYCRMRVARLEQIAPAARSAALGEPFSPGTAGQPARARAAGARRHRARLRPGAGHGRRTPGHVGRGTVHRVELADVVVAARRPARWTSAQPRPSCARRSPRLLAAEQRKPPAEERGTARRGEGCCRRKGSQPSPQWAVSLSSALGTTKGRLLAEPALRQSC